MTAAAATGSTVLDTGKTPAEWVLIMEARGIAVSERTLRAVANRIGAHCRIGNAMLITPEQLDQILLEDQKCRSKRIAVVSGSGSGGALNTTAPRSRNTTEKALEHLTKQARKTGSPSKRSGKGVVTLLATKRNG